MADQAITKSSLPWQSAVLCDSRQHGQQAASLAQTGSRRRTRRTRAKVAIKLAGRQDGAPLERATHDMCAFHLAGRQRYYSPTLRRQIHYFDWCVRLLGKCCRRPRRANDKQVRRQRAGPCGGQLRSPVAHSSLSTARALPPRHWGAGRAPDTAAQPSSRAAITVSHPPAATQPLQKNNSRSWQPGDGFHSNLPPRGAAQF